MKYYQVDAFTNEWFKGNPAGVCPMNEWVSDELMQKIAFENHLSETAFFVPNGAGYQLRWFTPHNEVNLCGHATLAAAHVIFSYLGYEGDTIEFQSKSGPLFVTLCERMYRLDFPEQLAIPRPEQKEKLSHLLGVELIDCLANQRDYLCIVKSEREVRELNFEFAPLTQLDRDCLIVSAQGEKVDAVSRFFAPKYAVPEDPVTGSAHCAIVPYWCQKLGKSELNCIQASKRGGELRCQHLEGRVYLYGAAITYLIGEIL